MNVRKIKLFDSEVKGGIFVGDDFLVLRFV